eukprot:2288866-Amphidinium_carterae.1
MQVVVGEQVKTLAQTEKPTNESMAAWLGRVQMKVREFSAADALSRKRTILVPTLHITRPSFLGG